MLQAKFTKGSTVSMLTIENGKRVQRVFTAHATFYNHGGWVDYQLIDNSTGQLYRHGAGVRERDLKRGFKSDSRSLDEGAYARSTPPKQTSSSPAPNTHTNSGGSKEDAFSVGNGQDKDHQYNYQSYRTAKYVPPSALLIPSTFVSSVADNTSSTVPTTLISRTSATELRDESFTGSKFDSKVPIYEGQKDAVNDAGSVYPDDSNKSYHPERHTSHT
jgi:hypothetical protein